MSLFTANGEIPVVIPCQNVMLDGFLHLPTHTKGIVVFVHGSGSSRFSLRNQLVAKVLNEANLGTLLFDLLTPSEDQIDEKTLAYRFDIEFLAARLVSVTDWLQEQFAAHHYKLGYFGASTGAAAALVAAAERKNDVQAIVSRGGRPDLAGDSLGKVKAATLLIIGGNDPDVLTLNKEAYEHLKSEKELVVIPGATHLFPEPGALVKASEYAKKWFTKYLA